MSLKDHFSKLKKRQAGNVFFALFAATAMVGLVGAGLNTVIRGPATSVAQVTRQNMAENSMIMSSRLAIVAAATQVANDGDCDEDGYIEPLEYRDAGALPHPNGGGYLPMTIGATLTDPWNTEYGYCVWDPGDVQDHASCDGPSAKRRVGAPGSGDPSDPALTHRVIAIISAGKNRAFETECHDYVDTAPANDQADTPLVYKPPGSDDIVFKYTYGEAIKAADGLWSIKVGDAETAEIGKDLEVTGSLELIGGGLILPDHATSGDCNEANDKQLRRNNSSGDTTLEICVWDGVPGPGIHGTWEEIGGSGGMIPDDADSGACDEDTQNQLRRNTATTPASLEICVWNGTTGSWEPMNGLDLWSLHANNTDIYRNAGNVGIGNTGPTSKLSVTTTTANDGVLLTDNTRWMRILSGTTGGGSYNGIVAANDNALIFSAGAPDTGNFVIAPHSAGTSGLRMNASGNVGIGAAPTGYKVDVNGNARIGTNLTVGTDITVGPQNGTSEGGHIVYAGSGAYNSWNTDVYQNDYRIFSAANPATVQIFSTSGSAQLNVTGNVYTTGAITAPEGTLRDDGGGWVRTYGATGWYSQTFGGGWHMTDTTWIRAYNGKPVFMSAGFDTSGASGVGCNGGLGGGYTLQVCGNVLIHNTLRVASASFYVAGLPTSTGTQHVCYNTGNDQITKAGNCSTSDRRLKKNIHPLNNNKGLESIMKMKPVSFEWKDKKNRGAGLEIGFIAQDVKEVFPELVEREDNGLYSVDYQILVSPLVKAVQELKVITDTLTIENRDLRQTLETKGISVPDKPKMQETTSSNRALLWTLLAIIATQGIGILLLLARRR